MMKRPHFIIIGAMKCMTSTLHEQLAAQPGIFMTNPKEPCYFSDDHVYSRGMSWYHNLFAGAADDDFCGESSSHYTKLPTYPLTAERMYAAVPQAKLIYVMRHPIDRLISHYIHEWTERTIDESLDSAIANAPRLVEYGLYAHQLFPYLQLYGADNILPVFFESLSQRPQEELERVASFIEYDRRPAWRPKLGATNVSAERIRRSPLRDTLMGLPGASWFRLRLVPKSLRNRLKGIWQMTTRPEIDEATYSRLRLAFDQDLKQLGSWLNIELSCDNFYSAIPVQAPQWGPAARSQFPGRKSVSN